jgi:hypothetical protein
MGRFRTFFLGFWKKALLVSFLGILVSVFLLSASVGSRSTFFTDALFWVGMSFFVFGLASLSHNMGAFNGLIYGAKCAFEVFRGRQKTSRQMIDGYVDFCSDRRRFKDVPQLMVCAFTFFSLSVISWLI